MIRADYPGLCGRCGGDINPGDRIVIVGGRWCHPGCAPGADDE